jgi:hypothetical protein
MSGNNLFNLTLISNFKNLYLEITMIYFFAKNARTIEFIAYFNYDRAQKAHRFAVNKN